MEQALGGLIYPEMTGMAALVFMLGLRHGFDPDHLVAIDGLTRNSASRWSGLFFSLGHGIAVTLIGVGVAVAATKWQPPGWLEQTGALISIGVLLALGIANLAVLRAPAGGRAALIGLRGRWLTERMARASHPAVIASVGAAFAVSFDTVSHALAFSLTGGALFAALLGLIFTSGMVMTDALNGLWVARMIGLRWMSAVVAFLCLLIAAFGILKYAVPGADAFAMPLAIGSIALLTGTGAFAVLRSRSAYREAGS